MSGTYTFAVSAKEYPNFWCLSFFNQDVSALLPLLPADWLAVERKADRLIDLAIPFTYTRDDIVDVLNAVMKAHGGTMKIHGWYVSILPFEETEEEDEMEDEKDGEEETN